MHHHPLYPTDLHRTIGVLQHWQLLLAPQNDATATTITLADIQAVTLALQQAFGPQATLEAIIQQLVGQDLRGQVERRRQDRSDLLCAVA